MIGAVISRILSKVLIDNIAGKKIAQCVGEIVGRSNIGAYWPKEKFLTPEIIFMAAMCRWLMAGAHDALSFRDTLAEMWPQVGTEFPEGNAYDKLLTKCYNPISVYASSVDEVVELYQELMSLSGDNQPKPWVHIGMAEAVAVYLYQYHILNIDGHVYDFSPLMSTAYADFFLPEPLRDKCLVFKGVEGSVAYANYGASLPLKYKEALWCTELGAYDLNPSVVVRAGASLFPIHDAAVWPYSQMPYFDELARAALPDDIASLFIDFDNAVYMRHNFDMTSGRISQPVSVK